MRTRIASDDPVLTLLAPDTTLRTTELDQAAILRILLDDPTGSSSDHRVSSLPPEHASNGG